MYKIQLMQVVLEAEQEVIIYQEVQVILHLLAHLKEILVVMVL